MNLKRRYIRSLLSASLFALATPSFADWTVNSEQSSIHFSSVKKNTIGEVHHFQELSGSLDDAGAFKVEIALASVNTGVEIRDTRMKEQLFQTSQFPKATISATLPKTLMSSLKKGATFNETVSFTLDLHGKKVELSTQVAIAVTKKEIIVSSIAPIMLDAAKFDLVPGIETLKQLASLDAIATAVPVTLHLVLTRN